MTDSEEGSLEFDNQFSNTTVIDSDVHPTYYVDDYQRNIANNLEEPYASMLHPDRRKDSPYPGGGWPQTMGGNRSGTMHADLLNYDQLRNDLLSTGIDVAVVDALSFLDSVRGTERAVREMRAANDVLVEQFLDPSNGDVAGLINVAARDPEAAVEEIDRLGDEDGVEGVVILPGSEYQKPMGDPSYDAMYRAAEDNDLTMVFHCVDDTLPARATPVLNDFEKFVSMHTLGFPWSAMLTLTSLIVQGAPVKFPNLDFVILEAGVGWIPYMMGRLNREVAWRKSEAPLLEKSAEEHIRESFYFGTQPLEEFNDPSHMKEILQIIGAENLLFATDYPHWDFDDPTAIDKHLRAAFSEKEREMVLHKNAAEAFGIGV